MRVRDMIEMDGRREHGQRRSARPAHPEQVQGQVGLVRIRPLSWKEQHSLVDVPRQVVSV
jgi:hypothetical protein